MSGIAMGLLIPFLAVAASGQGSALIGGGVGNKALALLTVGPPNRGSFAEPPAIPHTSPPSTEEGEDPLVPGKDDGVRQAVEQYLKEIEEIERQATEARAGARKRLLDKLGEQARAQVGQSFPGLIGTADVDGKEVAIAYHYHHGKVFPPELIRDRFHAGEGPQPSVTITLVGYVELPQDTIVKVWHAAGGVNEDWGELHVGDRLLGRVGDDLAKKVIYVVKLPKGRHPIRWVLTGGTFQHNFLKFEDPQTGELLRVYHDNIQHVNLYSDNRVELMKAAADPDDWPPAANNREWRWEVLGDPQ